MQSRKCAYCHVTPIVPPKRKYCEVHSSLASALWKREHRRRWKASGDRYWQSNWKHATVDERRAYAREYMRSYRFRRKSRCLGETE